MAWPHIGHQVRTGGAGLLHQDRGVPRHTSLPRAPGARPAPPNHSVVPPGQGQDPEHGRGRGPLLSPARAARPRQTSTPRRQPGSVDLSASQPSPTPTPWLPQKVPRLKRPEPPGFCRPPPMQCKHSNMVWRHAAKGPVGGRNSVVFGGITGDRRYFGVIGQRPAVVRR